jgi:hypothetical protein
MALDRACNHEEACTVKSRTRGWLAGRHRARPRWPSCTGARQAGLASSGCVPGCGGQRLMRFKAQWVRFALLSIRLITTMAITLARSRSQAVTERSTGTAATPMFWIRQPRLRRSTCFLAPVAPSSPHRG